MKKAYISLIILVACACTSQYPYDLGGGYSLDYNGNSDLYILNKDNTIIINAHVLNYTFNTTYIIVVQRPWDSIPINTLNYKESVKKPLKKVHSDNIG